MIFLRDLIISDSMVADPIDWFKKEKKNKFVPEDL